MSILEKVCHYCGRPAKSGYVRYDDGTICCKICEEHYPVCSRCQKPARQHITQDERIVCAECVKTLHRCEICQKFLLEKAYKFGELRYCVPCYDQAEKCSLCAAPLRPVSASSLIAGKKICLACQERLPKCGFCGKSLMGQHWKNEPDGLLACPECYPKAEKCVKCGVPLKNPKSIRGKVYCSRCSPVQEKAPQPQEKAAPAQVHLASAEKQYTFLVVKPTNTFQLKAVEETLLVNNCFKNYHEYVKKIVAQNKGIVVNSAEEKVLCLFDLVEDAVRAAEAILKDLPSFNKQYNKLQVPLLVHVGLNSMERSATQDTEGKGKQQVESLYGSVTDLAYKVLEVADPGTVVITEQTYEHLVKSRSRFAKHRRLSDLHLSISTYRLQ